MMNKKFKIISLASLSLFSLVTLATATVAWFAHLPDLAFGSGEGKINVGAGSETSYYESGSGDTINDPYIISNRNHLYNLAWLQYMGRYNSPSISQKYFKLKNDIDMTGIALPPIGTDEYPFLGHFDGNNKTISNLKIVNDDPTTAGSEFGVTKPSASNLTNTTQPTIIGFFGVVGQSPLINDLTYNSSIVSISDLTLNNITVKSVTDETLIGLAAGYVDGTMSGVKISGNATLDVDGESTTAAINSITNHVSDYGLVGYSTKTSRSGSYSQDISAYYDSEDSEGQGANWGGSIAIDDLFDRLASIKSTYTVKNTAFATEITETYNRESTKVDSVATNTSTRYPVFEYNENTNKGTYNSKMGAYQMGLEQDGIHYLSGGHFTKKKYQYAHDGYQITDGTNYLTYDGSSLGNTTNGSNDSVITTWHFILVSGNNYFIRTNYNSSTDNRYLYNNDGVLSIGTGTSTNSNAIWTITQNASDMQIVNGRYLIRYSSEWKFEDLGTYYIKSGSNYISSSSINNSAVVNTTSQSSAAQFFVENNTGRFYFMKNDTKMYLTVKYTYTVDSFLGIPTGISNQKYEIQTTSSTSQTDYYYFTFSGGVLKASVEVASVSWGSVRTTATDTFVYYSGGWKHTQTNGNKVTPTLGANRASDYYLNNTLSGDVVIADGPDAYNDGSASNNYMDYSGQDVTYFPLNTKEDYTPADNNTGYIIGGSSYTSSDTDYGAGTVRISSMYELSTNITNFNRDTYKLSNVRTYNASGKTTIDDSNHNYAKYDASKDKVESMLKKHSSANKVYGLHFMQDSISVDHLITARYAQINTSVYSDYQLPASSIDFNLKERGYVNFFAGTYGSISGQSVTTIDSFFSLHLIRRNSSNSITNIYEIEEILSDGNQDHAYVYKLSNGKYTIPYSYNVYNQKVKYVLDTKTPLANSYPEEEYTMVNSYPSTYSVVFDTSWIKIHNNFDQKVMYYFEIPINCGEFCLGSVAGSNFGAYLVYLDIGAFARDDDAVHAYNVTTNVNSLAFPDGVDFAAAGATGATGGETFCVYLPSNITGSVSFAISTNAINIDDSSSLTTYSFKGSKYSDTPVDNAFIVTGDSPGALVAPPAGGERLMHITIDCIDGSRWNIDILDALNENGTILSTSYPMIKQDGVNKTVNDIPEVLGEVLNTKIRTLTKIVSLTRNTGTTQFVSTATYDDATRKVVDISISQEDLVGTSVSVGDIATGYTISINGTRVYNNSVYPSS